MGIVRYPTKKIKVGSVEVGGDAPISVQSMTYSKTRDIEETLNQIWRLAGVGCDIVRVAVLDKEDAQALPKIKARSPLPIIADIHFNYRLGLMAGEVVDGLRINPGNIGGKERVKEIVKVCQARGIPIRIGVNGGSLEKRFLEKYGATPKGMVESALWHIKLLEDLGFTDIKVSLKASDVVKTIEAYRMLRPLVPYPFHLGVTEAGTTYRATIKSAIGIGTLLAEGIGDTLRVSITGELEEEVRVGKEILRSLGLNREGVNLISCPTCGRIEVDLPPIVEEVERRTAHIKHRLNLAVMGCPVNGIGEAKEADLAIACGRGFGLVIRKGEILGKYRESELVDKFISHLEEMVEEMEETPTKEE
jgi:(E)-4-hydroxy-3-methylbut-2-enyl-diphosphate synthase